MKAEFEYDVFLSHSAKDKAVVRQIAEQLRKDGLKVPLNFGFRISDFGFAQPGMSANAFGSDWAQLEAGTCGRGNLPFRDPLNQERRLIPLRLDNAPIKGSLAQFSYINWRPEGREQEYSKLLEACRDPATWPQASISRDTLPVRKQEALQANLLPLVRWPNKIFTAKTRFQRPENLTAKAKQLGGYAGREWFLKSGKVVSFRPLDSHPWPKLITGTPMAPVETDTWAWSDDPITQRDFVRR